LATDGEKGGPNQRGGKGDLRLSGAVHHWPTPTRNDALGAGYQRANGWHFFTLPGAVGGTKHLPDEMEERRAKMWPTPTASEDAAGRPGSKMQKMLGNHPDIRGDLTGGTLNPTWVEWLMGWPIGWTDCAASATDKFRRWLDSHGIS
jgi:hypothetical protein